MIFATPVFLWLLWLLPLFIYWDYWRLQKMAVFFSDIRLVQSHFRSYAWLDIVFVAVRALVLCLLILALARPQKLIAQAPLYRNGIDMMILMDASGSMAAEDLAGGRLTASKDIIKDFVIRRPNDRIGLVVFGVSALTKAPLTFDHTMLVNILARIRLGEAGDATAIGQALTVGLNRLRTSEAKSKIIILVTDGENNAGNIGPLEAAQLAQDMNVKIYTIGIGSPEGTPMIVYDPQYGKQIARNSDGSPVLTKLNVTDLVKIADLTSGRFYQAKNLQQLAAIFADIDALEKVKQKGEQITHTEDVFAGFVFLALVLLLAEFVLRRTLFKDTPCIL